MEKFDLCNGHLGLSSAEILYSNLQKVYIKSKNGEEKSKILRITLEMKSGLAISLGKVLSLKITDDNDCTFYYSLLLTVEDFGILKSQQGLLVNFEHFSCQLIKLLETCRAQEYNKFILVFDEEDSVNVNNVNQNTANNFIYLKVIETNNFKNLCHLTLKVLQGTDTDVKNHMSLKIANLADRLAEQEKKCKTTEMNLSEALTALERKTKELTEFQIKSTEEKNSLKLEMSQQISEEREKLTKGQMEWQQKLEIEKSQQATHYQRQLSELNEQISSLTFNNKNLYEAKCHFEACVKEKNFHLETLEKQILQITQELNLLKKQNAQLDQDYHEKDKSVVGLKTKLAVVEQELKDKGKYLEKQQELLKVANEQKSYLEEALNEKECHLQKKQAAVQSLSADLMKSNEIIAKLQTDFAANTAKMKLRTDIALEQERILEKKTQEIASQIETIKELEEKIVKLEGQLISTKTHLEEANKKIEDKESIIKKNDNGIISLINMFTPPHLINWLNRRLTESTSGTNLNSNRTGIDSMFAGSQPKGTISNLAKGWPPWLVNSVVASHASQVDSTGTSNSTNGIPRPSISSTPVEILQDQCKIRLQPSEENIQTDNKDSKGNNSDPKPKGLDPKYFQSSIDKDYALNPHVMKVCDGKDDLKLSNSQPTSRTTSARQPISAYFPKKPVPLQFN